MAQLIHGGVLRDGICLYQGILDDISAQEQDTTGIISYQMQHLIAASKFEVEEWDGQPTEQEYVLEEERRQSIYHEAYEIDPEVPIASSAQFEPRTRSDSLAAALLHCDTAGAPSISFHHLNHQSLLEAEEYQEDTSSVKDSKASPNPNSTFHAKDALEVEHILTQLLFSLRSLNMNNPDKYAAAVERLRDLEKELREAGAVCPPDPAVANAVARALAAASPGHDIQIRVNQSRHTTTTKTVYETETPGMVGLDAAHIRDLQKQMLSTLTSGATDSSAESGTTQKKETAEEGFTNEDGSVVVSKKMTRVVTTTRTTLPGEGDGASSGE